MCGSNDPETIISKRIDERLRHDHQEDMRWLKLLLLGIGESGKSTITKQMRIIHINGFTNEDLSKSTQILTPGKVRSMPTGSVILLTNKQIRGPVRIAFTNHEKQEKIEKINLIKHNIMESIVKIVGAMRDLNIPLEDPALQESVDFVFTVPTIQNYDYPQEFFDHVQRLWRDRGVQNCFSRSNEYHLIDCAQYFLDQIDVVRKDDFIPSNQDILRCRTMTTQIQKIEYKVPERNSFVSFRVFDVGGQRGARKQWIQLFDKATAILFIADVSSFDLVLREDERKNRLVEAMDIFKQIWDNKFLADVSIILFLNKIDVLNDKISSGKTLSLLTDNPQMLPPDHEFHDKLTRYQACVPTELEKREFLSAFPDPSQNEAASRSGKRKRTYPDIRDDVIQTAVFLKRTFQSLAKHSDWKSCQPYYTCAIDTRNITRVLQGCRSIIINTHLKRFGVIY